ncbi:amidohydrolase [Falsiruegeria mediterranea]|uniref:N-substituted formamide deformylase n=1 Tax=Falsiruegeria mediterranea M17 TaxID=1200281 RepID=A0A2R8CER7_9RHOB|nr:amidohydrolase [Falsiruegeria mediterranea]SPJ30798.1 N-substituted formamide deformylase [Falsiruegeria mediterranea M17]
MNKIIAAAVLASLPVLAQAQSNRLNPTADYALINGRVHTMDADSRVVSAIGIEGDKIVYVGEADGLKNVIGIGTEVIDLEGRMVLPGFVDGHIHAAAGGLIMLGVDLQTDDKDELFARIRNEVESNSDDVILGYGVRFNPWTDGNATAAMLDEIDSERPIYLWAIDGHAAWVNSKALELAGIDKDTPETVPGFSFFERDTDGNPTGWIVEIPAQMQVLTSLIDVNPDFMSEGVGQWLQRFAAAGITAVHDHGIQGMSQQEGFQMMADFEKNGQLPVRFVGSFYWNDGGVDPLPGTMELRAQFNSDLVQARYLKINMDGGDDKWNALYVDPYDDKPLLRPEPIIPVDLVKDAVRRADAAGIDVTRHCFGDLAVRTLLDAVEAAIAANPPRERAHKITHDTLIHSDDYARFAELGVIYDSTGSWMSFDPLLQSVSTSRLGMERVKAMFPVNRVADAGGVFSFGSDWPVSGYVSEYRPLAAIEVGTTRQLRGREDVEPLGREAAKLPLQLALEAHTINAAKGMGMETLIGSLEVGKKADIVVLEQDLFEVKPGQISDVAVSYTIMNGQLTYEKGD